MRSFSRAGLGAVTAVTMATSTFPIIAASVLAAQLIDEFDVTRAQIGLLVAANGVVGAFTSPLFGRITDRLGSTRSVVGALVASFITLIAWASSPSYAALVGAAFLGGLPNAWGNPATNALIVDNIPTGTRGLVTGIKQSGVQIGIFLGGLLLPVFTGLWSWRVAMLMFLALPIGGLIAMIGRKDHGRAAIRREGAGGRLPITVRWIALYGFISGLASSAITGFVPLFANEVMGWTETAAGLLISLAGLAGIGARLFWPRLAERSLGHGPTLRVLASISTLTGVLLALASLGIVEGWVLPVAVLLLGGGAVAWNAVGMLAVMDISPEGSVGKGTGLVLFGFLLGLAIGAPLMGFSVDRLGSYTPGWVTTAILFGVAALLSLRVPTGTTLADHS